ncbi:hypothetical protein JL720_7016 [Aureococcus anophagefferens]|nr:hypothetical protein JL720_7016 [Aureococcus anophagefferens]
MIAVVDQPSGDVELGSTMVSPLIPAAVAVDLVAADLEKMRGVVVRQETQFLESFAQGLGLPYEAKNRYKVSALPEGRAVAASPTDAARWRPTNKDLLALPAALVAHEESKCGWRAALACCGCLNFRALTMHFFESVDGSDEGAGIERFRLARPFRMGIKATIGLCAGVGLFLGRVVTYALPFFVAVPLGGIAELVFGVLGACVGLFLVRTRPESLRLRLSLVEEGGRVVGEVVEAFEPAAGTSSFEEKWWTCCCLCTFFARVTSETEPGFTLRRAPPSRPASPPTRREPSVRHDARGGAATLLLAAGASAGSTLFNIAIPAQLNKDGGYAHVAALFGQPKYDESLSQRLVYAKSTLCDVDASMRGAVSSPYLMFAERGGCTFVVKARNAQALGASGLVIADDRCVCGTACEPQARCEGQEPIMADDGSGSDISIASVMLYKEDGDAIRDYFRCGAYPGQKCAAPWTVESLVQASLEYTVPAPDARVEWELWTTSIDEASLDFLRDFKATVLALGTKQLFTPHFYTYNGSHYGCDLKLASDDELCGNLCTNGGRYCAPDPDGKRADGIAGADVVAENLRRTCVWKRYGGKDQAESAQVGVGETWWDYVGNFSELCGTAEDFVDAGCRSRAMREAGVDEAYVDACVADSGGLDGGPNAVLDHEVAELENKNIVYVPECIVNDAVVWGGLSPLNVLSTVCHGYARDALPPACDCVEAAALVSSDAYAKCLADSVAPYVTPEVTKTKETVKSGIPWYAVFLLVVAIVVVMLLAGLAYWKHTQAQMRDQVRGILAEYMPLEDLGTSNPIGLGGSAPDKPAVFSVNA